MTVHPYSAFYSASSELMNLLESLNIEQLNKKPFEESWSAGQVGHHLVQSYGIVNVLAGNREKTNRPYNDRFSEIEKVFLDFSTRMKSPEYILPSEKSLDKDRLLSGISKKILAISDIEKLNPDLTETCLDYELPGFGKFTGAEWIYFMACHTMRHNNQLKNIISKLSPARVN